MNESCIVYYSRSTWAFEESDLTIILEKSRLNNKAANISGVLLYLQGSIVQVLEGDTEAVESLFKRIQNDPRHTDVKRLINRPITKRIFADWTMGYKTTTSQQMAEIKSAIYVIDYQDTTVSVQQPAILRMIKAFYEGNQYS